VWSIKKLCFPASVVISKASPDASAGINRPAGVSVADIGILARVRWRVHVQNTLAVLANEIRGTLADLFAGSSVHVARAAVEATTVTRYSFIVMTNVIGNCSVELMSKSKSCI
jgi:hypothetical protein